MITWDLGHIHMEFHNITIALTNSAGLQTAVSTNLDRPGNVMMWGATIGFLQDNDNSQAIGTIQVTDAGGLGLNPGEFATSFLTNIIKAAGTAGTDNIFCFVYLIVRDTGPHQQ